jgi:predicted choloylglycine hydrolase
LKVSNDIHRNNYQKKWAASQLELHEVKAMIIDLKKKFETERLISNVGDKDSNFAF